METPNCYYIKTYWGFEVLSKCWCAAGVNGMYLSDEGTAVKSRGAILEVTPGWDTEGGFLGVAWVVVSKATFFGEAGAMCCSAVAEL